MAVTVGMIGCGHIARFHFAGLKKAGARVKWVCDLNAQAARPWAEQFQAAATARPEEVFSDPEVQAVWVLTTTATHRPLCLAAIAAGKAVVCEKTLAGNADDALEIARLAEQRRTVFYTSYMKRFIPAVQDAKKLLPSVGRIITTHIRAHQCWGAALWSVPPTSGWLSVPTGGISGLRAKIGGGILLAGGSHIMDLVHFFFGRVRRLYGFIQTQPGFDVDNHASALLETDHGAVHYEALAHPLTRIGYLRDGWDERIEITGTAGRLEILSAKWDQPEHKASVLRHYDEAAGKVAEHCYEPVSPFERAAAFFCEQIGRNEQGAQSRLTGYETDEVLEHIRLSAARREAVEVKYRL